VSNLLSKSVLTLLIASSLPVQAENVRVDKESMSGLEEIHVTAHRTDANLNQVPASIGVITKETIEALQPSSMSQLLRYESGVEVDRSGSRFGDASISIRGIGGNRVMMLHDGVRMPDGFGSAGSDQARGSFNARNLERVEILKGPASALYGSDALGGVVLLQSLDPQGLVKADGSAFVELNAGYDSGDERRRTGLTAAGKIGVGYGLLQLEQQSYQEREINSSFKVNPKDGDRQSLFAKYVFDSSDNQHWELIGEYWGDKADNNLLTNLGPVGGPPGSAVVASTAEDESSRWRLGVHHVIEDVAGLDQLHWQLDYQESQFEQNELETTASPMTRILKVEHETFDQEQWSFNLQGQKHWGNHALMMGLDTIKKELQRPVDVTFIDQLSLTRTKSANGVNYPGKTFPDTEISQYGAYLQDNWQLSSSLRVILGVRYDHFRSEPKLDDAYLNFNLSGTHPESRSDSHWSPHAGLVFALGDQTSVYANYTTGFRAPPVDDQFISRAILIPVPGVPHEVIPNNDLESETSKGYELGLRWQGEWAKFNFAYYDNRYEDFIDSQTIGYRDQAPVFVGARSIRQIQYQNVDSVRIKGWEVGAALVADAWMPKGWQGQLNMTAHHIDGENRETGQGLNSVGPNKVVIGLDAHRADGRWGIGWHVSAVDAADDAESLTFRGQPLTAYEPPSYVVHDINLFWNPVAPLRFNLSVFNLTDKKYWGSHMKGANADGDLDAQVAAGRSLVLGVNYQF